MFLVVTRFGSNFNKRWYFGFVFGILPNKIEKQRYHPKYPWWKRWRISFQKTMHPESVTIPDPLAGTGLARMTVEKERYGYY